MYSHSDTYPLYNKKSCYQGISYPFVTRFLRFYQQSYTLSGSELPYYFVVISSVYESYSICRTSTLLMNQLAQATPHTQWFAVTVSFRCNLLTLRQLWNLPNICFYFAEVSTRTNGDTASTWCACGTQKVQGTFWGLIAFYQ